MEATTTARNVKKDSRWVMPYVIDACYQTHCQAFKQGLTQAFVQCQACWSFFSNECFQHHIVHISGKVATDQNSVSKTKK